MLESNKKILIELAGIFPESFRGLSFDGNYLVFNGEKTDISQFDIQRLVDESDSFTSSLSVLSAEDIFKIIRLHTEMLTSKLELDTMGLASENEKKVEMIKNENPLMKNISLVTKNNDGIKEEIITIVDSTGNVHPFRNDYKVNVFAIYEMLKYRHPGQDITPDELIQEINRKSVEIKLEEASRFQNHDDVSEEFENKMNRVNQPYKNDKMYRVLGNEENDIAVVQDLHDGKNSKVITFDNNEFGDLILENHEQNVSGTDITEGENNNFEGSVSDKTDIQIDYAKEKEIVARLISTQEFYNLLESPAELTEEQRKSVDLYYSYLGDLMLYEDYLLDELKAILNSYRAYVDGLQNRNTDVPGNEINSKQQEAIDKCIELEIKKNESTKQMDEKLVEENVRKLTLVNPNIRYDNAASASIIQVIAFVIGIAIILTAITIYLLG